MYSSKVPEITLIFWIIKIAATTLGETAGDAVSMSMKLGYLVSSEIFSALFIVAVIAQISARGFHPALYWTTIIATTTAGTTLADFADRSLGIGYAGASVLLFAELLASLLVWYRCAGSVAIEAIDSRRMEMFYWITIMFSQTLGTALGDWASDSAGLGYRGSAACFGTLLLLAAFLCIWTKTSRVLFFWTVFILTRPLGAVLGDFLDKPIEAGGLALSRFYASAALMGFISICLILFPQRTAVRSPKPLSHPSAF